MLLGTLGLLVLKPTHVGPSQAYPNPNISSGLIASSDYGELTLHSSCGTYSQCHRKTTSGMKETVCQEYPTNCTGTQEIDHIVPIALGGADDVRNLWAEPENLIIKGFNYGYHTKDRLENLLVLMMKQKQISPLEAQQCILKDWVVCYQRYVKPTFGGLTDPDESN